MAIKKITEVETGSAVEGSTHFLVTQSGNSDSGEAEALKRLDVGSVADYFAKPYKKDIEVLKEEKINKPKESDNNKIARARNGEVEWADVGQPTDEQTEDAVTKWLDKHPESTTTVQKGSIMEEKISVDFLLWIKKDYVTPEMFGAVGDGEHDDSDAFFKAIRTKKTVFIPAGNYYLSSFDISEIAYDGMKLISDGANIYCAGGLICDRNFGNRIEFALKGVNIIGNNVEKTIGIRIHSGAPVLIDDCKISNFGVGLQLTETYDGHIYNSEITDCITGIFYNKLSYANSVNAFTIKNCVITNATTGIETMVGANNTFDHVTFEYCDTCFVLKDSPMNYIIKECYAEGHKSFVVANNSIYTSNIAIINNFLGFTNETSNKYMIDLRNCRGLTMQGNVAKISGNNYFVRCVDGCDGIIKNNVLRSDDNSAINTLFNNDLPIYYSNCTHLQLSDNTDVMPLIDASKKIIADFYNADVNFTLDKDVLGVKCYTPNAKKTCTLDITVEESGWYTATFLVKTKDTSEIALRVSDNFDNAVTNKIESFNKYARHTVTRYFNANEIARIYIYGVSSYGFMGFSKNCNGISKDFYLAN